MRLGCWHFLDLLGCMSLSGFSSVHQNVVWVSLPAPVAEHRVLLGRCCGGSPSSRRSPRYRALLLRGLGRVLATGPAGGAGAWLGPPCGSEARYAGSEARRVGAGPGMPGAGPGGRRGPAPAFRPLLCSGLALCLCSR